MGLLNRAEQTPPQNKLPLTFHQWAESCGFAHCGILCPSQKNMSMQYAYGVDCQTVCNSVSTMDFWAGTVTTEEWLLLNSGEGGKFSAFMQFFGKDTRDKVESVAILRVQQPQGIKGENGVQQPQGVEGAPLILFVYDFAPITELPPAEKIKSALPALLERHKENLFEKPNAEKLGGLVGSKKALLFTVSVGASGLQQPKGVEAASGVLEQQGVEAAIFDEIFHITKKQFSWPDFIYSTEFGKIKIAAIISNRTFLIEQLTFAYKDILGLQNAQKIKITGARYCTDSQEILNYLLRG